jgi:hypothetical protein
MQSAGKKSGKSNRVSPVPHSLNQEDPNAYKNILAPPVIEVVNAARHADLEAAREVSV